MRCALADWHDYSTNLCAFASLREIFLRFVAQLPLGREYGTSDVPLWLLQTSVR
jgi:hypothetical protein